VPRPENSGRTNYSRTNSGSAMDRPAPSQERAAQLGHNAPRPEARPETRNAPAPRPETRNPPAPRLETRNAPAPRPENRTEAARPAQQRPSPQHSQQAPQHENAPRQEKGDQRPH
jgi:hypothetical protein